MLFVTASVVSDLASTMEKILSFCLPRYPFVTSVSKPEEVPLRHYRIGRNYSGEQCPGKCELPLHDVVLLVGLRHHLPSSFSGFAVLDTSYQRRQPDACRRALKSPVTCRAGSSSLGVSMSPGGEAMGGSDTRVSHGGETSTLTLRSRLAWVIYLRRKSSGAVPGV